MKGRALNTERCVVTLAKKGVYFLYNESKTRIMEIDLENAKKLGIKSFGMVDFVRKIHRANIINFDKYTETMEKQYGR